MLDATIIKAGGVIATYGSEAEGYPRLPFYELMRKTITIRFVLVYVLSDAARQQGIADVNAALEAGALRPIIAARFPLHETVQAHQAVERGGLSRKRHSDDNTCRFAKGMLMMTAHDTVRPLGRIS